ncbi:MAG: hypothetical protein KTR24_00535, partial [Saprospiraceae bacterium]|nr:hypothetical protein [Saprospiraceae bacterium]
MVNQMNPTYSIILESANLGMSGFESLMGVLNTIEAQTKTIPGRRETVVLIDDRLSTEQVSMIKDVSPQAILHKVEGQPSYFFYKMEGVPYCTGEVVLFLDMDVFYGEGVIKTLLSTFADIPEASISASQIGCATSSPVEIAMSRTGRVKTGYGHDTIVENFNFKMNSFAIKREVLLNNIPKRIEGFFRGDSMMWKKALEERGYRSFMQPGLVIMHEIPSSLWENFVRIITYSADRIARSQYFLNEDNEFKYRFNLSKRVWSFIHFNKYNLGKTIKSIKYLWQKDKGPSKIKILASLPIIMFNLLTSVLVSLACIISNKPFIELG